MSEPASRADAAPVRRRRRRSRRSKRALGPFSLPAVSVPSVGTLVSGAPLAALILILVWAPLPYASNVPWAWSVLAVAVAVAGVVWALSQLVGGPRPRVPLVVVLAGLATAVVWAWAYAQTLPVDATLPRLLGLTPHPLWGELAGMGFAVTPSHGLDAEAGRQALLRLMTYGVMFWLCLLVAVDRDRARTLLVVTVGVMVLDALYGITSRVLGWETILGSQKAYAQNVTGTFINRNSFATWLNLGIVVCLAFILEPFLRAEKRGEARAATAEGIQKLLGRGSLLLLATMILLGASLLTASRGGLVSLGLAIVVLVLLLFLVTRPRLVFALSACVAVFVTGWILLAAVGGDVIARLDDETEGGRGASRINIWLATVDLIRQRPDAGFGYGSYEAAMALNDREEMGHYAIDLAHNTYLEHTAELGLPATLLLYAAPLLLFLYCLWGVFRRRRGRVYPLIAVVATVLVAAHSLIDFSLQMPAVGITYAAILGIGVARSMRSERKLEAPRPPPVASGMEPTLADFTAGAEPARIRIA